MTTTPSATSVRIKAEFGYYGGTYNAPHDGYIMSAPQYDHMTGRETCEPLTFASVAEAYDYLTSGGDGCNPADGLATEYNAGHGNFSASGTYYASHGQHSRPIYTIVAAKSGRCSKAIVAECESINNQAA